MIQGAIFDMDGVLIDSMPVWEQAGAWYLESQGKKPEPGLAEVLFAQSMQEAARYMREVYQIPKTEGEIVDGVIQMIYHQYAEKIPAKKGVLDFLSHLKGDGVQIAVATSSDRALAEAGLGRLGILGFVQELVTCKEVDAGKGQPDVYFKALQCLGTERKATWVFEDALHGICTAKQAGFPTVAVYDSASQAAWEKIKKEAVFYMEDLADYDRFYQFAFRHSFG